MCECECEEVNGNVNVMHLPTQAYGRIKHKTRLQALTLPWCGVVWCGAGGWLGAAALFVHQPGDRSSSFAAGCRQCLGRWVWRLAVQAEKSKSTSMRAFKISSSSHPTAGLGFQGSCSSTGRSHAPGESQLLISCPPMLTGP